ncbi:MAG: DUF58 domain-containing protein [Planctomycetota bacterium]
MRPTRLAWLLLLAGAALAALPAWLAPGLAAAWLGYVMGVLALGALDGALAPRLASLAPRLVLAPALPVGLPGHVAVELDAPRTRGSLSVEAEAEGDPDLGLGPPARAAIDGRAGGRIELPLTPRRRGRLGVHALWLRWQGPFGLLERVARLPADASTRVVPDLSATRQAALALDATRHAQAGLKVERFVGDGSEFDAMREYVPGLDARSISWRATARHRRLVCHQFRAERNHPVVIAFDTGRLMGERLGEATRLDHAIHAGLRLAWTALRTGDRVGMFAFDALPRSWVPPDRARGTFAALRHGTAELEYGSSESNFTLGLLDLVQRLPRRTLIVLMTDVVDAIGAELLMENVARLVRRHVVLFVTLADPQLRSAADSAPADPISLSRAVVSKRLLDERAAVLERMVRLGVLVLDATPERLGPTLVSRYLEAKRRERV